MHSGRNAHERSRSGCPLASQNQVKSLSAALMLHEAPYAMGESRRDSAGVRMPRMTVEKHLQPGRSRLRSGGARERRGIGHFDPRKGLVDEVNRTFADESEPCLGVLRVAGILTKPADRSKDRSAHENGRGGKGNAPAHSRPEIVVDDPTRPAHASRGLHGANDVGEDGDGMGKPVRGIQRRADERRRPLIVGIEKRQPFSMGRAKSGIASGSRTPVDSPQQPDARVVDALYPLGTRIGGAVVDDRHDQIVVTLPEHRLQASFDMARLVMKRNDDANGIRSHLQRPRSTAAARIG